MRWAVAWYKSSWVSRCGFIIIVPLYFSLKVPYHQNTFSLYFVCFFSFYSEVQKAVKMWSRLLLPFLKLTNSNLQTPASQTSQNLIHYPRQNRITSSLWGCSLLLRHPLLPKICSQAAVRADLHLATMFPHEYYLLMRGYFRLTLVCGWDRERSSE